MQNFNLPNALGVVSATVSSQANPAAQSVGTPASSALANLIPVAVTQTGQQVRVTDLNNRLIATGMSVKMIDQATAAISTQNTQSLVLYGQRKNLFDAIISAEQQKVILDATAKLPNLTKLTVNDVARVTLRSAIVSTVNNQSVTVKLTPPLEGLQQVTIDTSKLPVKLNQGQVLQLYMQQIGNKWIAKLILPDNNLPGSSLESKNNSPAQVTQPQSISQTKVYDIPLSKGDPLVSHSAKAVLASGLNLSQPNRLVDALLSILPNKVSSDFRPTQGQTSESINQPQISQQIKQIIQQLSSGSVLKLDILGKLTVTAQLPIAKLPVPDNPAYSKQAVQQADQQKSNILSTPLQNVRDMPQANIPSMSKTMEQHVERFFQLPEKLRAQLIETLKSLPIAKIESNQMLAKPSITSGVDKLPVQVDKVTMQSLQSSETIESASKPNTAGAQADKAIVPKAFTEQLSTLIRQHFVNAEPSTESAKGLAQVITELNQSGDINIRNLSKQIQQALMPLLTKREPDLAQIQALLQMPALPISTSALTQISAPNNMVSGLVALLQISLLTRLPQRQNSTSEKISQILGQLTQSSVSTSATSNTTTSTATNQPPAGTRALQEFTQIEQRNQLLRTLSKTLSNHHYSKLTSAESALQGNESLYYSLPAYVSGQRRDIELLVKREKDNEKQSVATSEQRSTWHLTMLMDIGEFGEMLSKCKLKDNEVSLDLYTSSEQLRIRVLDFLPLLNKRLSAFGLDIVNSHCQLGKIPSSLRPKPYQLLHTQA